MKRVSVMLMLLFLCLFMPRQVWAEKVDSEERSSQLYDNPELIYDQFQDEIYNKEYEVKYGFAREGTYAYTDWHGSAVDGKVEKFTGLMVVSETESYAQIIYEKEGGYDIGWIEQAFYREEVLFYYGAEKQLLADGIYKAESYAEDRAYYLELTFEGNQQYSIRSIKADAYLEVLYNEDGVVSGLAWKEKNDGPAQLWELVREYDKFYVRNKEAEMYLVPRAQKSLGLTPIVTPVTNNYYEEDVKEGYLTATWTFTRKFDKNVTPYRNFLQYDPDWASEDYGPVNGDYSGKMAAAGCAAVSTTNMVYALTGQFLDPMLTAEFAVEEHYRIVGSGTDSDVFPAAAEKFGDAYGFRFVKRTYNVFEMRDYLKEGCTAISYVPGHYVTVADYNEENETYLVLDPHPIPKRPTTPFGDWFKWTSLESGGLASSCYFIFEKTN